MAPSASAGGLTLWPSCRWRIAGSESSSRICCSRRSSSKKRLAHVRPDGSRARRVFLGITQSQLARVAKLGLSTVVDSEKERRLDSEEAVRAIQTALQRAGIEFIDETQWGKVSCCENGKNGHARQLRRH